MKMNKKKRKNRTSAESSAVEPSPKRTNSRLRFAGVLFLIVVAAFATRVGAAWYWQTRFADAGETAPLYFGDSVTYWRLAEAIAEGRPYQFDEWRVFRMPGYPLTLAPVISLFGESQSRACAIAARIENALIGSLLVAAVGLLALQIFRQTRAAALAALFAAFEPCNVISSVWILSETPFCLVMIAQIALFLVAIRTQKFRKLLLVAVLFAIASAATVYFRPSWLYFALFLTIFHTAFLLFFRATPSSPKEFSPLFRGIVIVGVFAPIFVACMSPWWIRNYRATGRFVSTTLQMGPSLYDGLNPDATGASDMRFVETFRRLERENPSADLRDTYEYRLNERLKRESIDWIKQNPQRAAELAVVKFFRFWNVYPNEPAFSQPLVRLLLFLTSTPLLAGAVCGFWKARRQFREESLALIIPAIYLTILHMIFVSSLRYRVPPALCLMILAAFFFGTKGKKAKS
ncbi:MAG: phospholipid carrier-dependent glycosyltransferase [Planctomycetaceae bacterium]|jgi:hypothetical protein|nr:phospholipid carrier-dependent glycosyltransferase [Planctomycetaceae bacterium]